MPPPGNILTTPLNTLFAMLRQEGFEIGVSAMLDIQKLVAGLEESEVAEGYTRLRNMIGPILCRNKEEQEKFYKVFASYENYIRSTTFELKELQPNPKTWFQTYRWYLLALTLFLLLGFGAWWLKSNWPGVKDKGTPKPRISLFANSGELIINQPAHFGIHINRDTANSMDTFQSADLNNYNLQWEINKKIFHNRIQIDTVFTRDDTLQMRIILFDKATGTGIDTIHPEILVACEPIPGVRIISENLNNHNVTERGDRIQYEAGFTNPSKDTARRPYRYQWRLNDSLIGTKRQFSYTFNDTGQYTVSLLVDARGLHCSTDSLTDSYSETVQLPSKPISVRLQGSGSSPVYTTVNWKDALLIVFIPLLIQFLSLHLLRWKRRKQEEAAQKETTETAPSGSDDEYAEPFRINFNTQEAKIEPGDAIGILADTMRKRQVSAVYKLNIKKTIQQTIRLGGMPTLAFSPRSKPIDFLVLIDQEYPDSHLSRLFEYLVKRLVNEQVHINTYYYYKEPLVFHNANRQLNNIPIDKLAQLHGDCTLLIYTNTKAFFKPVDGRMQPWVTDKLKAWDSRIIITPVAKKDWDHKEYTLFKNGFIVVSADVNAYYLVKDEVSLSTDRQKIQTEKIPDNYTSRLYNFNRFEDLQRYLNDEGLLQWVCALAVYPYIDWDLTLAMGKAVLERYNQQHPDAFIQLDYTRLLKISRISWMETGQLSDSLRLRMLEYLSNDMEALARETLLECLRQIEETIPPNALVKEEFDNQKIINKFLLHTYRPQQYTITQQEYAAMKTLVEKDHLDWTQDTYLKKGNNTLIKKKEVTDGSDSISLTDYFEKERSQDQDTNNLAGKKPSLFWRLLKTTWFSLAYIALLYFAVFKPLGFKWSRQDIADIPFLVEKNTKGLSLDKFNARIIAKDSSYPLLVNSNSILTWKNPLLSLADSLMLIEISLPGSSRTVTDTFYFRNSQYLIRFSEQKDAQQRPPVIIQYTNIADSSAVVRLQNELRLDYDVAAPIISGPLSSIVDTGISVSYHFESDSTIARDIANRTAASFNRTVNTRLNSNVNIDESSYTIFVNHGITAGQVNLKPVSILPAEVNELFMLNSGVYLKMSNYINVRGDAILTRFNRDAGLLYITDRSKAAGYAIMKVQGVYSNIPNQFGLLLNMDNHYFTMNVYNASTLQVSPIEDAGADLLSAQQAVKRNINAVSGKFRLIPYYKTTPGIVYLPFNGSVLASGQLREFNRLKEKVEVPESSLYGTIWAWPVVNRFNDNNATKAKIRRIVDRYLKGQTGEAGLFTGATMIMPGDPFDRDYLTTRQVAAAIDLTTITYDINSMKNAKAPDVYKLDLSGNNLRSLKDIPKDISIFKNLKELNLTRNYFRDFKMTLDTLSRWFPGCNVNLSNQLPEPTTPEMSQNVNGDYMIGYIGYPDNATEANASYRQAIDRLFEAMKKDPDMYVQLLLPPLSRSPENNDLQQSRFEYLERILRAKYPDVVPRLKMLPRTGTPRDFQEATTGFPAQNLIIVSSNRNIKLN
jgi:PKD repeat protein